jgi:hypothetical protein
MPYLGNNPTANFATVTKDTFSGNGSTTAFTLSKTATTNGVAVYVENVRQIPTTAYAISGTTLTFTAAPVSGTNNIYVMHHNTPVSTATHPSAQDLTCAGFTSTGIDDNADATSITIDSSENVGIKTTTPTNYYADDLVVTAPDEGGITVVGGTTERNYLAFADGTSGDARYRGLISYDHNTDKLTLGAGGGGSVVLDGNGILVNATQPAFSVTANQQNNISINANTTIQFANEIFDQNSDFNTSNYTFTAPVTGKYMLNVNLRMDNVDIAHMYMYMILVTSNREYEWLLDISEYQNDLDYLPFTINVLADMDASDTAVVKMHIPNAGSAQSDVVGSNKTTFSGFLAC